MKEMKWAFQYRKRYGPVATQFVYIMVYFMQMSFNTASGMAQLQLLICWVLQCALQISFNTASGMAQLQQKAVIVIYGVEILNEGFNTASGMAQLQHNDGCQEMVDLA